MKSTRIISCIPTYLHLITSVSNPKPQTLDDGRIKWLSDHVPDDLLHVVSRVMPGKTQRGSHRFWRLMGSMEDTDPDKTAAFINMVRIFSCSFPFHAHSLTQIICQLQRAYRDGIEYTTNQAKVAALEYVLPDPANDYLVPKLLPSSHKSERGWSHNVFGRALCPLRYRAEYDQDPEFVPPFCDDILLMMSSQQSFSYQGPERRGHHHRE